VQQLIALLTKGYNATAVGDIDLCCAIESESTGQWVLLQIDHGAMTLSTDSKDTAEFTIYFSDEETAVGFFTGQSNAVELFLESKLKSSGYIVTTFRVLHAFVTSIDL